MENEEAKKRIMKRAAIIAPGLLVAALIIALTLNVALGWFAISGSADANNMNMRVDAELFELAVDTDYMTDTSTETDINEVISYLATDVEEYTRATVTDLRKPAIIGELVDLSPKSGSDVKLCPGSYGYLRFYIKPKISGDLTFGFSINLRGYSGSGASDVDDVTANLLNGHILFFENPRDGSGRYSGLISNSGEFEYTITGAVADTAYPVTVYWIWPATFGQMVLSDTDPRTNGKAVFAAANSTDRNTLISFITAHPEKFLINSVEISSGYSSLMENIEQNFAALGDGYNNADQRIGDNTKWVITEIRAHYVEPTP